MAMTHVTPRFSAAVEYAAAVHGAHERKGTDLPYVSHVLGVAALVLEDGGDEDETIAALLHDSVEDAGGAPRLDDVRARFGERVAELVDACTDYDVGGERGPWKQRKRAYVNHIDDMDASVRRISLADKLHNARAILRDYREVGDELWTRFNSGRDGQLWYYRSLADRFAVASDSPMATELRGVVDALEREAAAD